MKLTLNSSFHVLIGQIAGKHLTLVKIPVCKKKYQATQKIVNCSHLTGFKTMCECCCAMIALNNKAVKGGRIGLYQQ